MENLFGMLKRASMYHMRGELDRTIKIVAIYPEVRADGDGLVYAFGDEIASSVGNDKEITYFQPFFSLPSSPAPDGGQIQNNEQVHRDQY
jgi:hypothetical protein